MKKIVIYILAISILCGVTAWFISNPVDKGIEATVARVVDGDTIELANHDVVRLIGVDAPEKDQPYYNEILKAMKFMEGKFVRLEKDSTNKDRYGRYLRYVYLDGKMVNLELVRSGMAYAYVVFPDNRYESEFLEAEYDARKAGVGIWDKSRYSSCVSLESFHYNAKGDDSENLGDEFFSLRNSCDEELKASGWTVRNKLRSYDIPNFVMKPRSSLNIYSGNITMSGKEGVYLSSDRPIWNNEADSLYLRDEIGKIILSRSYKKS